MGYKRISFFIQTFHFQIVVRTKCCLNFDSNIITFPDNREGSNIHYYHIYAVSQPLMFQLHYHLGGSKINRCGLRLHDELKTSSDICTSNQKTLLV